MNKYLVFGLCAVALALCLICGVGLQEARSCRRSPNTTCVTAILRNDRPDKLVARVLLFRPGGVPYMQDLRSWAYAKTTKIADSYLNRFLLERDLSTVPPSKRGEWLVNYPISINPSAVHLIEEALHAGSYESLAATTAAGNRGQQMCKEWIEQNLKPTNGTTIFVRAGPFTLSCREPRASLLLFRYWPSLSSQEREEFLETARDYLPKDPRQLSDILDWYRQDVKDDAYIWLPYFLQEPEVRPRALILLKERLAETSDESESSEILKSLTALAKGQDPTQMSTAVDAAFELADTYGNIRPELAVEAVKTVLDGFYAEKAQPTDLDKRIVGKVLTYLSAPDSSFKKGVIVLLANAGNSLANSHIDEAFTGDARRLTFFDNISGYTTSQAAKDYVRLSGHDYIETGKSYPPAGSKDFSEQAALDWEAYVKRYRWFPGTDDAYYRLAYVYLAQGNYQRSVDTVRFFSGIENQLPDIDAAEYVRQVYYDVASSNATLVDEELACVRVLLRFPLAKSLISTEYPFDDVLRALNCTATTEHPSVHISPQVLKEMQQMATNLSKVPIAGRLVVVHSSFSGSRESFLAVFYSKFSDIHRTADALDDWSPALEIADVIDRSVSVRPLTPSELQASVIPDWIYWHASVNDLRVRKRYKDLALKVGASWSSPYED